MSTSRYGTSRALVVAAVTVAGALTTGAAAPGGAEGGTGGGTGRNGPAAVASPAGVTLTGPDARGFRLDSQRRLTEDVYKTVWSDGDTTIRVTTRADSRVRVARAQGAVTVDTTQVTDTTGASRAQLLARHKRHGMSAEAQQLALGLEPATAHRVFADDKGPIIDSWCVDIEAEGGLLHSHGCNVRRLDQDDANGRYIADEMTTSAVSSDYDSWFPYGLTRVDSILIYKGGEEVVRWAPISDKPVAECGDVTVSVEGKGGGASATTPICPDTFGPSEIPRQNDPRFGAAWSGPRSEPGKFMGTEGVTLVKQAAGAAPTTLRNVIRYSW
ncbi:hypothetical protein [Streptomyces sp. NPDC058424]|uniref:hypothetical protein n=1 Tax=Streptomyces sp. NPDC058424 TaxID=3346491 RepID=UPI003664C3D4